MQRSYTHLDVRRILIGSASLVALIGVVYFIVMFAVLFESAKLVALGFEKPHPEYIDFFLFECIWWMWPPLLLGIFVWVVTIVDAFRHQPTPTLRVIWTVAVVAGQLLACIIYWAVQLWLLVFRGEPITRTRPES